MKTSRRNFIEMAALAGTAITVGQASAPFPPTVARAADAPMQSAYKYRIAYGCWLNDMRNTPLPLQQWPAPQLDDEAIVSAVRAMDVQSRAGFNYFDAWGLFATYGYPPDIASAFTDENRRSQVKRLIQAAAERKLQCIFGLGLMSWGYDQIIKANPKVQGRNRHGQPLEHVLCGAQEDAWRHVEKILECAMAEYDFHGVHLESADQGWCECPECAGKDGAVGYNVRINMRAADYVKRRWPEKIVTCIPIFWLGYAPGCHFDDADQSKIIDLSRRIDCFMDQGWTGTYIPEDQRKEFIKKLHCDYGTSGGLWAYHTVRWDRSAYFLPYPKRTSDAIRRHFADGARACMFYQGPVMNPGVEVTTAVGGRILADTCRDVVEVLAEVIDLYYRPKNPHARNSLVKLFLAAEDAYFGQWMPESFAAAKAPVPGQFFLSDLLGETPGPARYLLEPYLTATGRRAYKRDLMAILKDLASLDGKFEDDGRLRLIQKGIGFTLTLIDTIRIAKNAS